MKCAWITAGKKYMIDFGLYETYETWNSWCMHTFPNDLGYLYFKVHACWSIKDACQAEY